MDTNPTTPAAARRMDVVKFVADVIRPYYGTPNGTDDTDARDVFEFCELTFDAAPAAPLTGREMQALTRVVMAAGEYKKPNAAPAERMEAETDAKEARRALAKLIRANTDAAANIHVCDVMGYIFTRLYDSLLTPREERPNA